MSPGMLASHAYSVRATAVDMARFTQANMGLLDVPETLRAAIARTHTRYFTIGAMTQDLIWEQYRYPVDLKDLQAGNSAKVSFEPNPATRLDPPLSPGLGVFLNKTGSTNGFASYVAFVPGKGIGIVLLANKNYPIDARVDLAYRILADLDRDDVHAP